MISSFIITFRETLEAALIVGIILAYLIKTKRKKYRRVVFLGIAAAILASIIGALLFNSLAGGFTGRAEEIFEGTAMLIAAILVTYMILWMLKHKHIAMELRQKVDSEIIEHHKAGIFFLVFISVFREGIETVIFLNAANLASTSESNLTGALLGIFTAIMLGYVMFVVGKRIDLKAFFNVTGVILILFAAGLTAHGVHEFQEAGIIPVVVEHVWDINPQLNPDGSYPALHEKGTIGSIFKGLLGYNGDPSLIEVVSYLSYLFVVIILYKNINKIQRVIPG